MQLRCTRRRSCLQLMDTVFCNDRRNRSLRVKKHLIKLCHIENSLFSTSIPLVTEVARRCPRGLPREGRPGVTVSRAPGASPPHADRSRGSIPRLYPRLICTHAHIHKAPTVLIFMTLLSHFPPTSEKSVRKM